MQFVPGGQENTEYSVGQSQRIPLWGHRCHLFLPDPNLRGTWTERTFRFYFQAIAFKNNTDSQGYWWDRNRNTNRCLLILRSRFRSICFCLLFRVTFVFRTLFFKIIDWFTLGWSKLVFDCQTPAQWRLNYLDAGLSAVPTRRRRRWSWVHQIEIGEMYRVQLR